MENKKIVQKSEPITLVGGGPILEGALNRVLKLAPLFVAADGGAEHAVQIDRVPEVIIGDLDSLSAASAKAFPDAILHKIEEQENTDFEKCLLRIEAPLVLGIGFMDGRLDHSLASFHALKRFAHKPCVLLGANETVFLCPPKISLDLKNETPLSLFPLGAVTGNAVGLQWSFEALDFVPGGRIGTSNYVAGPVEIEMDGPEMLCILPETCFENAVKGLLAARHFWPVRAE